MLRLFSLIFAALVWCIPASAQVSGDFPPDSEDGQCFARVLSPAVTETIEEEVLVSPESYRIEVTPAVYEARTERLLIKEAATHYRLIPAITEIVEEQVLVEPERIEKVVIPAEFETYTDTIVIEPARETWKAGAGLFGRNILDNGTEQTEGSESTGELLCRVMIPAVTETITRQRMVSPARVEEHVIPARYETVRREVVVEPPRYVEEEIPAVYEDRVIRTLVKEAEERRIPIPAVYTTVDREVVIASNEVQWAEVLCATNTDRYKVAEIQGALTDAGFPTLIDGYFGPRTQRAMEAFQRSKNISRGYMTVETAQALDIDPYGPPPPAVYAVLGGTPPPRTQI